MDAKSFYIGFRASQQSVEEETAEKTEMDGIAEEITMLRHVVVFPAKCGVTLSVTRRYV